MDGQGWVAAGELSAGSRITSRSGSGLSVGAVTWQRQSRAAQAAALSSGKQAGYAVYNFEVEKTHSYFVGNQGGGTWVHNENCHNWADSDTLAEHSKQHGPDFNAQSDEEYAKKATQFYQRVNEAKMPVVDYGDGTFGAYERGTNTFGAYNADGTTRTFMKPDPGYWARQLKKGKSMNGFPTPGNSGDPLDAFR